MMMNSKLPRELRSKVVNELVDHNDPPFNPRHNSGDIYGWRYQQYHRNPDFLSLREVSRDWNETLEADAHLWTNIQISSDRDLVVAKSAIQRSAHRPLSIFIGMKHGVSVYVDEPWIEDTIQFIATCIHRCVRLTLHLHWQKIAMALQYWSNIPAPCLRLLYLRDSLDKEDAISGGYRDLNIRGSTIKRLPNLFAGYMPLLEVVALDYVNINWDPMPFVTPKVSNFTLWLPEGTTVSTALSISTDHPTGY
ncbi:hypothetical protein SISSUDRAFT_78194 [Sistotremastrum suecicum HHB10207 ss-3]|uniref:F-box domain-containing protein n=1 Tax=Sistotremastrum suecicum HHB10207 ss-3 TaxID=1314776 RepID=A0A166H3F0_9AGAM|nr:hypothetical protein SISSUDRAFT_78194 [Sistotremastrum suecicum HHB10207 ss-3]